MTKAKAKPRFKVLKTLLTLCVGPECKVCGSTGYEHLPEQKTVTCDTCKTRYRVKNWVKLKSTPLLDNDAIAELKISDEGRKRSKDYDRIV